MPETLVLPLFLLAMLVFLGWFAVGTTWNVRRGDVMLKWLRQGLPLVGERTTMRWLGSSVLELKINKSRDPFRTLETLIAFEPRDVVFLWALARLRGRRDVLILRAQLRSTPDFELEAFVPHGWTAPRGANSLQARGWTPLPLTDHRNLTAFYSGEQGAQVQPLVDLAARACPGLVRLAVHRSVPNLELHWLLPDPAACPARDLFLKVRQLGEDVLRT